jgi:hypothetical protein
MSLESMPAPFAARLVNNDAPLLGERRHRSVALAS